MYGQGFGFSNWQCGIFGFLPGPLGTIMSVLLLVAVLVFVVRIIGNYLLTRRGNTGSQSMDILNQRYAAGEISRSEFEQIKRDISVQP